MAVKRLKNHRHLSPPPQSQIINHNDFSTLTDEELDQKFEMLKEQCDYYRDQYKEAVNFGNDPWLIEIRKNQYRQKITELLGCHSAIINRALLGLKKSSKKLQKSSKELDSLKNEINKINPQLENQNQPTPNN